MTERPDGSSPTAPAPRVRTVPAEGARHGWRAIPRRLGRARTSTVVLGVLFVALGLLYLYVRPESADSTTDVVPVVDTGVTPTAPLVPETSAPATSVPPTASRTPTTSAPDTSTTTGDETTPSDGEGTSTTGPPSTAPSSTSRSSTTTPSRSATTTGSATPAQTSGNESTSNP